MVSFDDDVLLCPRCRGNCLHHGHVTVYDRSEDEPRITKTTVDGPVANMTAVENNGSGNPSLRRGGIAISFACELCSAHSELTIAQHKGSSLVEWRTCKL